MSGVDTQRLVRHFIDLVRIDSPSFEEGPLAATLERELTDLGLEVRNDRSSQGNVGNIVAVMRGDRSGTPIFLAAHMDTVEPGRGIKPQIDGGVIRSDGSTILAADCKASIAAILEALLVVTEDGLPHGNVEVLLTYCEEKGLMGAKALDSSLLEARMGFVIDSSNKPGSIIVEAPAQDRIVATFHGKAAHAGLEPEDGINALVAAADAIYNMPLGRIDEETTANIGLIKGGSARNVVPDRVEIEGEARSRSNEKLERQTAAMVNAMEIAAKRAGARLELNVQRQYGAYRLEESSPVVQMACLAAKDIGLQPTLMATGGGTDANILNSRDIPTAVLGTGMSQPHSLEEHIEVEHLAELARYLVALIQRAATA